MASPSSPAPTNGRPGDAPRIVLVLGGGGMRGMAHLGVLRAMRRLKIEPDVIVGTSIGALVGAMHACGATVEEMEEHLTDVQKGDYFKLNFVKFLLKGTRAPSMYQGQRLWSKFAEILPKKTFAELEVPFFCNATRLETGGSVFWGTPGLDEVSLVDAVYSSCALPGIFEPFEHEGYNYMDGGIVDSLPLRFAKTLRPDLTIAVDISVKASHKSPNYKSRVVSTLFRAFEIVEEVIVEQSLHMHADYRTTLIQPKVGHLSRFDFHQIDEIIGLGEEEALKVLLSHAATRRLVQVDPEDVGLAAPINTRDYVSVRLDPTLCIACGMCEAICETNAFWAKPGEDATVRKLANYECTRDHACSRNCPTGAISLGNL